MAKSLDITAYMKGEYILNIARVGKTCSVKWTTRF